jgi:hypothetical protein
MGQVPGETGPPLVHLMSHEAPGTTSGTGRTSEQEDCHCVS